MIRRCENCRRRARYRRGCSSCGRKLCKLCREWSIDIGGYLCGYFVRGCLRRVRAS